MSTLPVQRTACASERRATPARGVVLLAGAAGLLLVELGGLPFYRVPLVLGLTYLCADLPVRCGRGPLWDPPGCCPASG